MLETIRIKQQRIAEDVNLGPFLNFVEKDYKTEMKMPRLFDKMNLERALHHDVIFPEDFMEKLVATFGMDNIKTLFPSITFRNSNDKQVCELAYTDMYKYRLWYDLLTIRWVNWDIVLIFLKGLSLGSFYETDKKRNLYGNDSRLSIALYDAILEWESRYIVFDSAIKKDPVRIIQKKELSRFIWPLGVIVIEIQPGIDGLKGWLKKLKDIASLHLKAAERYPVKNREEFEDFVESHINGVFLFKKTSNWKIGEVFVLRKERNKNLYNKLKQASMRGNLSFEKLKNYFLISELRKFHKK